MKITVIRAFYLGGQVQAAGTVVDVEDRVARELIHYGRAAVAVEKPAAAPKPAPAAKESSK